MVQINSPRRKALKAPRVTLIASVASGMAAVLLGAPAGYRDTRQPPAWSSSALAAETMQQRGFADLVGKVKPAVISVRVMPNSAAKTSDNQRNGSVSPFRPGDFHEQFGFQNMPDELRQRRAPVTREGSGFFISADGYAVTNNHIVHDAMSVQVTMDDGTLHTAAVVGTDARTDLALIKVDGKNFPYVKFADRESRIGDWVVAVGNPFGLGGTVTAGIVSAHRRNIGARPYIDYIQIDAPINKGNSGGPTFDMDGDVIGVNTAIISPSGGSVGIAFDIPADTARMVVGQLKDKGYVSRAWMGLQTQPVPPEIAGSPGTRAKAPSSLSGNPRIRAPKPGPGQRTSSPRSTARR
jgi:serine protease Do